MKRIVQYALEVRAMRLALVKGFIRVLSYFGFCPPRRYRLNLSSILLMDGARTGPDIFRFKLVLLTSDSGGKLSLTSYTGDRVG